MQLVADGVEHVGPDEAEDIGRAEVIEKFGVGPELVRDVLALTGDTSDNVPGVPGIGVKTAAQLLHEFGSLEGLLANLDRDQAAQAARGCCSERRAGPPVLPPGLPRATTRRCRWRWTSCGRGRSTRPCCSPFLQANGFKSLMRAHRGPAAAAEASRAGAHGRRPSSARLTAITALGRARRRSWPARVEARRARDRHRDHLARPVARQAGRRLPGGRAAGEGFYVPLGHVDEFGQRRDGQLDLRGACSSACGRCWPTHRCSRSATTSSTTQGVLARYGLERHARSTTPC